MIRFNVIGQTLKRTDEFTPASDSVEFLKAQFNIVSDEWDGYALTALFRHYETGKTYRAVCDFDGVCVVPWEVLTKPAKSRLNPKYCRFYVTLTGNKGASVATTNEFEVEMRISGYTEGEEPAEPTPDAYAQYVEVVKAEADKVATAAEEVKTKAESVEKSVETVENIAKSNEKTAGIIKNSAANAFKGTASGEVVRVDDVSPIEHTASVWAHGKNLLPFPYTNNETTEYGVTFTTQEDGGVIGSGTPTGAVGLVIYDGKSLVKKGVCTFSISGTFENLTLQATVYNSNGDTLFNSQTHPIIINMDECKNATRMRLVIKRQGNNTAISGVAYPQLEIGETATEYTPYIDPSTVTVTEETTGTTYTPSADGTCDVVSVSPTMTLLTDTEGITIECEYNRDTNIVMGDVETALDSIIAMQNLLIGGAE